MYTQKTRGLESASIYGVIGTVLEFAGYPAVLVFHGFGLIISIIGLILLLIAIKSISNYYNNYKPFRYMIYSLISGIALSVVAIILFFMLFIPFVSSAAGSHSTNIFIPLLLIILLTVLVPGIGVIIFQYLSYNNIGKLTGIDEFNTAALLQIHLPEIKPLSLRCG